ncbi:MAG: response regulator [Alphaproteobacteria bacterium]|nr:response regulator [Alphaproteobacteria bacterium]
MRDLLFLAEVVPMDIASLLILLVEDEAYTRRLVERILRDQGARRIFAAANGAEALDLIKASASPFDVVICDLRMPVMDGFAFVDAVRGGDSGADPATPILILTSMMDAATVEKVLGIGVDAYALKPISADMLVSRIASAVDPERRARMAPIRREQASRRSRLEAPTSPPAGRENAAGGGRD